MELAPFTTFKIGGPADVFVEVQSPEELVAAVQEAREIGVPWFVLGVGANILVSDAGVRGLVVRNCAENINVSTDRALLTADSGAICYPDVIEAAVSAGLSGLEHYVGIPSTIGGALWQNLHFLSPAPERERTIFIAEVVHEADILTSSGDLLTVGVDYFEFGYDYSILHVTDDLVLRATFQLEHADESDLRRTMAENLAWRATRHPPLDTEPSAGSIFKKIEGIGAGRLIDQCGLKGARSGGIEITLLHANIMVNRGDATSADVLALIERVQSVVEERTGYRLEPEILMVGEFQP